MLATRLQSSVCQRGRYEEAGRPSGPTEAPVTAMGSWSLSLCNAQPLMVVDTSEEATRNSGC